ncbi:MAG: hypothetical protein RJQ21_02195 [Rhodospirillales bacterium]
MTRNERYIRKLEAELKEFSAEMDRLEVEIDQAMANGGQELDEFKRDLHDRYNRSKIEFEKMRASGEAMAEQVALSAEMAYRDFRSSLADIRKRLSKAA